MVEQFAEIKVEKKDLDMKQLLHSFGNSIRFLLKHWLKIVLAAIIGGVLGLVLVLNDRPEYSSKLTFILEEGKSGSSGLSSLAGQFGFDLGGAAGSSNILSGENIVGLLKARRFTREVLLTPYNNANSLADRYADIYGLREKWKNSDRIKTDVFFPVNGQQKFTRLQDSLLQIMEYKILNEQLTVDRPDKKMSFFQVGMTSRDEWLSKIFAERLVNNVVDFYIEAKTRRQRANVNRLQYRADSIAALLNNKTYSAAAAQSKILDINPAYQTAAVNAEVSGRNKIMIGTIYAEIVKNLEIQKVTLSQETPVIQVVDYIQLPLTKTQKSKIMYMLGGAVLGVALALAILLLIRFLRQSYINHSLN